MNSFMGVRAQSNSREIAGVSAKKIIKRILRKIK